MLRFVPVSAIVLVAFVLLASHKTSEALKTNFLKYAKRSNFRTSQSREPVTIKDAYSLPLSFFGKHTPKVMAGISTLALTFVGKQAIAVEGKGKFEYQPALAGLDYGKPRTEYPDFIQTKSGLQYKQVKEGDGKQPSEGDKVTLDWEGYTIGYYGRPFQTRNKVKGGAFDSTETDYFRFVVGSGEAVAALDEGVKYMKEGGITQIIVPAELGYPQGDSDHNYVGPKPSTFSGIRALNFVLDNQNLIDKTLLINVRLVRVDKKGAKKSQG